MVAMPTWRAISARSSARIIRADALLGQTLLGFVRRHGDQIVKLHHPAGAGLERLAVRTVHGAVADMFQLRRRR